MKRIPICIIFITLLLVAGCYNPLVQADYSLISNTPCPPPCWRGLTPGVSTGAEVQAEINRLPDNVKETLRVNTYHTDDQVFSWRSARNGGGFALTVVDGKFRLLQFTPEFNLRIGGVVDHFGDPEYLYSVFASPTHGGDYILRLFYPKKGLAFESWPELKFMGQIERGMLVTGVYYYVPGTMQNYYEARGWSSDDAEKEDRYLQPWPGFGRIAVPTAIP